MKDKLLMIIIILVLGSVLTTILIVVDFYTAPIIARNAEIKKKKSILNAFDIPYELETVDEVYLENISEIEKELINEENEKEIIIFFKSQKEEIAFQFGGSGLWGDIIGILALEPDLKTIKGVTIIKQEETPGLGGRITEKEYLDSFISKQIVPGLIAVKPGSSSNEYEVDTITGATMTCDAFIELLNEQANTYLGLLR
jgi:Na+-transporting NADH:ubiquinone oxidoreductase subunit C